ncbi:MAG: hypothetical protein U0794_04135 [Isosphaeraceae bacterium]
MSSFDAESATQPSPTVPLAGWLLSHGLALAILLFVLYGIAPRAEAVVMDFGIALSSFSQMCFAVASACRRYMVFVGLGIGALVALDLTVLSSLSRSSATVAQRRAWGLAVAALIAAATVALGTGIAAPVIQLQERLTG